MDKQSKMNWKTVFAVGGASTAYCIGAGFASGQETLQYYGSWGGAYPFILPALTFLLMLLFCAGTYKAGSVQDFKNPDEAYAYYCGKKLGLVVDVFCSLSIALSTLIMFAGSGATVNQYLGLPVWVGTLIMGVVSVIVVCLGLEKVTGVLGFAGVLIIIILAVVGVYCFFTTPAGIMEAQQHVLEYVEEGTFLQAQFLGIDNPIVSVISLVGAYVTLGMVFNVSLGHNCKNNREIWGGAVCSAVFFTVGLTMVLFTILFNMDYIAEVKAQVPMLAAIENILPALALPFSIVILIGVFTTITGYLWAFGRRFAEDKTAKQRIVVLAVAVIGVSVASFIPLNKLVNTIYPLIGVAGLIIFVGILIRMFTDRKASPGGTDEKNR
ncbi:YkvI family membrane protein [Bacilliculturomica massiliensis]|uniref:YkvI family membrane protein n=1 Tax=Bacilliculturomica massiliensis TaxID=1917867 RepID=UPI0010308FF7|nr:hypothetical protein [Bacilliculturomica massiliensis]